MKKILFIAIVLALLGSVYVYIKAPKQSAVLNKQDENISELTVKMEQAMSVFGITLKPIRIVEDSRCPEGVQCFWEGRLLVEAEVGTSIGATTTIFEWRKPKMYDGYQITLQGAEIKDKDEYATFKIEK